MHLQDARDARDDIRETCQIRRVCYGRRRHHYYYHQQPENQPYTHLSTLSETPHRPR
jgi:hypothetical protein